MGDNLVVWALVCLVVAMLLFMLEFVIPSAGLLGVAATVSLITGVVLLFKLNTWAGLVGLTVSLIALPFIAGFGLRIFPHTPVFRWLLLRNPEQPQADARALERGAMDVEVSLLGQEGRAVSDLRPVGVCLIDGRRRECLAATGYIRTGATVKVVAVDGMQVKVREA